MNARMRRLVRARLPEVRQLQPALAGIAEGGLTRIDDCIVFSGQRDNRSDFPDRTGYECSANHIHVDDLVLERNPEALVEQAVTLAASLNHQLCTVAPNSAFRFIISVHDDGGCTLRFHTVRAGEEWVAENLEQYAEEAVAVIESADLKSAPQ
ncbi:MAG: hypothetical protein ACLPXM_11730 [Terriglobales bacterium]